MNRWFEQGPGVSVTKTILVSTGSEGLPGKKRGCRQDKLQKGGWNLRRCGNDVGWGGKLENLGR